MMRMKVSACARGIVGVCWAMSTVSTVDVTVKTVELHVLRSLQPLGSGVSHSRVDLQISRRVCLLVAPFPPGHGRGRPLSGSSHLSPQGGGAEDLSPTSRGAWLWLQKLPGTSRAREHVMRPPPEPGARLFRSPSDFSKELNRCGGWKSRLSARVTSSEWFSLSPRGFSRK